MSSSDFSFIRFVNEQHANKPKDVIQFFDRKSFKAVYGEDAIFIANEYFKTLATITYLGSDANKLASQTIQPGQFENILIDLLENKQYKFEIWATKPNSSQWERIKKGSPGNVQGLDDILETYSELDSLDSSTLAIRIGNDASGNKVVGIAMCDVGNRLIRVTQFLDTIHFTNLESIIVQASGVKECVSVNDKKNPDCKIIADILQRCSVVFTEAKNSDFSAKDIEQDATRLLGKITNNLAEIELRYSMEALGCLIKYLELMADETSFGQYTMKRLDLTQFMHLDAAAIEALKLVPTKRDVNKQLNLFSLLDKCHTAMGSRRLMTWIRQPLLKLEDIERRLDLVEVFFNDTSMRKTIRSEYTRKAPDFSRILKRLQRNNARLEDCLKLYNFLRLLPELSELFTSYNGAHSSLIKERYSDPLAQLAEDFGKFTEMIEATIDLEAANNHEYVIRADFDDDLKQIAKEKESISQEIEEHSSLIRTKLKQAKSFVCQNFPQFGYCFRVSRRDEKALRSSNIKYFTVDTKKDGVRFKTVELKSLGDQYEELNTSYTQKQSELVSTLMNIVAGYEPAIVNISEIMTEIDIFTALAEVFSTRNYVRPKMTAMGQGDIILKQARHPCLELHDQIQYVPNDLAFLRDSSSFHIITGPNMGGKSTFIRSVGVIVLMAQVGCFVPCESASISIVDAVLCRVGAGDSQSRGVSTFMAEMLETTTILETATSNSLLIIDELGRGTSTYDGFGLAWAISEYLCNKIKAFCFFATHFHELTALANTVPTVTNYHVSAIPKENQLILLYQLRPGACDQSFGIHVAEMANFPKEVIKLAKRKAEELENFEQSDSKRQKLEGNAEKFLDDFQNLPVDTLPKEETLTKLEGLAKKYEFIS